MNFLEKKKKEEMHLLSSTRPLKSQQNYRKEKRSKIEQK